MIKRHPVLALAASSGFFATMALLARIGAAHGFSAAELVFVRMSVGAVGAVALFVTGRARLKPNRPGLLVARGLLGSAAILLFFFAITKLPVGEATLLNYTSPLFTTLFAILFLGERPGARPIVGLLVTLAGLALTVQSSGGPLLAAGVAAGLASAVVSGAAVATVRALRQTDGAAVIFFVFAMVAMAISGPLALPTARLPMGIDVAILVGLGLASLAAQLLFTDAMGYVTAVGGAAVSPLTPITAYLLGALVLGEPVTPRIALGIALALAGVALGSWQGEVAAAPAVD